ncbi:hypothetical protein [Salinicola sp. CPA57]|uniref:phage tail terminator protein n=1 Tax=Salinicola sp. CPA57 TaxID=1949080 RepID=UPI000DA22E4C|nr:hypothetical protein [Salinicola sp. CPA57]
MSQSPDEVDLTTAIIARLREQCPGLVSVSEAMMTEAIDDFNEDVPCAQVYLAEDGAAGEPAIGGRRQMIGQVYGVWLVAKLGDDYRTHRKALRDALFGWQPEVSGDAMAYQSGKVDKIVGPYTFWIEFWSINTWYRSSDRAVTI